ncbi:MAG: Crp/Fnr family transcriptional regulator [Planctomycetota bacterium]|jgi:CRP-like cAMP-binding protein
MEKKKFSKGDFICRENSPGADMYVIQSGKVGVYKTINGEKIALGVLNPGDFCGEMSLLLKSNRTASLVVLEDTEVLVLHKEAFLRKIQEDPRFAFYMITKMAKRLKGAQGVISKIEGEKRSVEIMFGVGEKSC